MMAAIVGFIAVSLLVLSPADRLDWIGIGAAIAGTVTMGLGATLTKHWKRPVSLLEFTAWQLAIIRPLLSAIHCELRDRQSARPSKVIG
ncbi:MAG: hypothetical protein V7L31_08495 [Nostoc sp.]|uniref:hypothetical protein n=1 Tax=Nostoc sp. TaxID=1180 RepID=UPI002FF08D5A